MFNDNISLIISPVHPFNVQSCKTMFRPVTIFVFQSLHAGCRQMVFCFPLNILSLYGQHGVSTH